MSDEKDFLTKFTRKEILKLLNTTTSLQLPYCDLSNIDFRNLNLGFFFNNFLTFLSKKKVTLLDLILKVPNLIIVI